MLRLATETKPKASYPAYGSDELNDFKLTPEAEIRQTRLVPSFLQEMIKENQPGGEKSLFASKPNPFLLENNNFLILDEPTNHFWIELIARSVRKCPIDLMEPSFCQPRPYQSSATSCTERPRVVQPLPWETTMLIKGFEIEAGVRQRKLQ